MSFERFRRRSGPGRRLGAALHIALLVGTLLLTPDAEAGSVEDLSRMLLEDNSYKVRVQAAQLLGKLGDPAGAEPLAKALSDRNKTVRWMAAQSLGKLGNPEAVPALRALLIRERDVSVRGQAEKALTVLQRAGSRAVAGTAPAAPAAAPSRRMYLTFGSFKGGTRAADQAVLDQLRSALRRELGKLPTVTFDLQGASEKSFGRSGQLGFLIDGNVSRLDNGVVGGAMEINCDVKVMVARWPSKSIILWTSAGAAVQGGSRPRDIENARRDCLEASAGQLSEDLLKFFQSQGG
jgi:hypothetical protein